MLEKSIIIHCDECNKRFNTNMKYERDARHVAWKNNWSQNLNRGRKIDLCPKCTKRKLKGF